MERIRPCSDRVKQQRYRIIQKHIVQFVYRLQLDNFILTLIWVEFLEVRFEVAPPV